MPAFNEVTIETHVDKRLMKDSESILKKLGLSTNEAIRIFLTQIRLRKALPFEVAIPQEDNSDILMPKTRRQKIVDSFYED
jgi:addiction module RelB/DinJ family antitoxin